MSLLVVLMPPAERLGAQRAGVAQPAGRLPSEWPYVLSADGRSPSQQGQAKAAKLPRADQTVLVLAEADVSWHQIDVPKAPAARLRSALAGVMEDALLDDESMLHLALGPGAVPGRKGWVACTDARRLTAVLDLLEQAGRVVDRVVPGSEPGVWRGHFHAGMDFEGMTTVADEEHPWLTLSSPEGVLSLRLEGALVRSRLPPQGTAVRWTTAPVAAMAAERLLGGPVPLVSEAARALELAASATNLRQFEFASRHRGGQALVEAARQFMSVSWRPVRLGLLALVVLQLLGLNAYAWQQRRALADKREAMNTLLRTAHPNVRLVLDAPLQMQRETDRLRAAAGRTGPGDLEPLLSAAAAAWPDGAAPTPTLRFESGSLTLAAAGWGEPQLQQFRERIRALGYAAELAEGRVQVTRLNRTLP